MKMIRTAIAGLALLLGAVSANAQSNPGLYYGQVPTAAQWNSYFAAKQDYLGFVPMSGVTGTAPIVVTTLGTAAVVSCPTCAAVNVANTFTAVQKFSLNAASLPTIQTGTVVQIGQADAVSTRLELDSFGSDPRFTCVREDGTAASPSTLQANDEICSLKAFGYNSSAIVGPAAAVRTYAAQNWTSSHQGTYLDFATTPLDSTTFAAGVRVNPSGGLSVFSGSAPSDPGAGNLSVGGTVSAAGGSYIGSGVVAGNNFITWGNTGGAAYPASATTEGALSDNFLGGTREVDFWNLDTAVAAGYNSVLFLQKTGTSSASYIAEFGTYGISIVPGTASTSTTTGALVVGGGAGIGGALNVGGTVSAAGLTVVSAASYEPQPTFWNQANDANGAYSIIQKSRGGSGAGSAVQVGDTLGTFLFKGLDSTGASQNASYLTSTVSSVGAGSVTADIRLVAGSSSAMIYDTSGNLSVPGGVSAAGLTTTGSNGPINIGTTSPGLIENDGGGNLVISANSGTGIIALQGAFIRLQGPTQLYSQATSGTIAYAMCAPTGMGTSSGGAVILDSSGTICGLSAERFKNLAGEITPEQSLDGIMSLHSVYGRYKPQYQDHGKDPHVWLLADEVEKMDSRCGVHNESGDLYNYSDRCVEAYLVGAIKELEARLPH